MDIPPTLDEIFQAAPDIPRPRIVTTVPYVDNSFAALQRELRAKRRVDEPSPKLLAPPTDDTNAQ